MPESDRHGDAGTPAEPTSVYLYRDAHGLLIYVGMTGRGMGRQVKHNRRAEWWKFATRQEIEHHPDRPAAAERELSLIREHLPPFNIVGNPEHAERRAAYLTLFGALQGAGEYRCGHCDACTDDPAHPEDCRSIWEDDGIVCDHCGKPTGECLWAIGHETGMQTGYEAGRKAGAEQGAESTRRLWDAEISAGWLLGRLIDFRELRVSRAVEQSRTDLDRATSERGVMALVDDANAFHRLVANI